ncbi:MAG: hypothetical protein FWC83_00870 [Alphaproteobacteria bacterium]|nr:hypothetical protein [Alphaproteobacteria bacterium]
MAKTEKFDELAEFYETMKTVMAAICVKKGGIATEEYVGRFFAADVLELLVNSGGDKDGKYTAEFESMKDMITPNKKPVHEMTLEEFEKVMNI